MSYVFHRMPNKPLPIAVAGDGIEIVDSTGKRYIDASGGAAVSCLGHSHRRVIDAIEKQARQLAYAHTSFFTTEAAEALAERLVSKAPPGVGHVYFVSGGSEAIEASLKLARQYFVEVGQPARKRFIARRQSYHGNTLGALAIGGNAWRREPFLPLLIEAHHVSPCYAYRNQASGESEAAYAQRLADELERTILELGPDTVAGFVAETVVGATAGAVPPVAGYFRKIREVCDKYGVLLILDEVMCGMGRTGYLYACEEEGVSPDLMTIAKGLGAGYQPIGAMLVGDRVYDAIVRGSGFFQHGHTYMGHATACAAALEVQRVIEEDDLLANVKTRGEQLRAILRERFAQHPHVGDIRGRGLFVGVEFVLERESKAPFDPRCKLNALIKQQAMARGLMVYPMGGTIDGTRGDHVLLAPPFICTAGDIERIAERLCDAVGAALTEAGAVAPR
ncbi:aspartate aminotransferase family protein [Trinickia diaoshuihuensis]|uniref:aspartate aminotransferase family protein n=1 Tax=Trinickia diaoshuihuensis TaxID=2292265 RepID=UPI000E21DA6D|nr:aspartate aminotransferase family protein [Trinickia diaoshuihuensis]